MKSNCSTGIEFVDRVISDQLTSGVYGIFCTNPAALTTLAIMVAAEAAKAQNERAARGETAGKWAFITLTSEPSEIMRRALAYAAKLPRMTGKKSQLSDVERERYEAAARIFENHLAIVDCSNAIAIGNLKELQMATNNKPKENAEMSLNDISQILFGDDEPLNEPVIQILVKQMHDGQPIPRPVLMKRRDDRYRIVDGRQRIEAARRCGGTEVEAYVIKELSEEEFRKLRKVLNQRRSDN